MIGQKFISKISDREEEEGGNMFYSRSRSVLKIFQSKNAENLEREKRNLARADQILPTKNLPNLAHYAYPQKLLEHVEILDLPFKYSSWGGGSTRSPL